MVLDELSLKKLIEEKLKGNENRKKHIYQVVENVKEIIKIENIEVNSDLYNKLIASAYLHDIGYSEELNKFNFHAYDGYKYLLDNEYDKSVLKVILHHTYSELLYYIQGEDRLVITETYNKIPLTSFTKEEDYIFKLLTLADMKSNYKGEKVTVADRISDIYDRYGEDSIISKHISQVRLFLILDSKIIDILNKTVES